MRVAFNQPKHHKPKPGVCFPLVFLICLLVAGTSGCQLFSGAARPTPTLVSTLAIVFAEVHTLTPSATFVFEPVLASASDAVEEPQGTPTRTITPWPNSSPTSGPTPTRTRTPTNTRIPTRTLAPSKTPTITRTPTITYTPTPLDPVQHILRPGLMSKVISPIQMELYVVSGHEGKVEIQLIGEDGRVIAENILDYRRPDRSMRALPELPFQIGAAVETARLQVSSYDAFGRIIYRSSVDLLLLSIGKSEINPAVINKEPYLIRGLKTDAVITGGTLSLEALARPVNDSPVIIELVDESGQVIAAQQVIVPTPTGDLSHTPFQLDIPYTVKTTTPVRLVIRQEGSRIPGTVAQVSRSIILEP